MLWNKIVDRQLSIYLLFSGLIVLLGIDFSYYFDGFFQKSLFPMMDIMYLVFYTMFVVAGILGLFFSFEKITKVLIYLSTITISASGFNYLLTGVSSFIVGVYFESTIKLATDFRLYGGFSFYHSPEESGVFGLGLNITSILLIISYRKFKIEKE